MSTKCEYIRPLLAELVYGEVDADVTEEIREHLRSCLACRRHQMAFTAVREDLQAWQPGEGQVPSGMRFIAPRPQAPPPLWSSRWFQGLAAAASFLFVAFLLAAATNVQVQAGPDGWAVSASLSNASQVARLAAAAKAERTEPMSPTQKVALEQIPGLDEYIDKQLTVREVVTTTDLSDAALNEPQMEQVAQRVSEMLGAELTSLDARWRQYAMDLVAGAQDHQTEQLTYALASVADSMRAERQDQMSQFQTQLMALDWDTDRRITQANDRIDSFFAAQVPAPVERERKPER